MKVTNADKKFKNNKKPSNKQNKKTLNIYGPILWIEFIYLTAVEPLKGCSLL